MKSYSEYSLDIRPFQAAKLLLEDQEIKSHLIFEDYKHKEGEEKEIAIFVFERYFFRNGSFATLTITFDNFSEVSIVKCISAGNGVGIFNISWGAGISFINSVRNILEPHIVDILKED